MRPILFLLGLVILATCEKRPEQDDQRPFDQLFKQSLDRHLKEARTLLAARRFNDAVSVCRAGLALDSTEVSFYNVLSAAYTAQGRYALAIEALESALRHRPDYAMGYVNLGSIYTKLGKLAAAETNLKRALELRPDHSAMRRRLGEIYLRSARYVEAVGQLQQALRLYPDDATLYFYLAQSLEGTERPREALEAFERAARLDIGFAQVYYRLGILARKQGQADLADHAMQRFAHLQRIGDDPNVPKQMKKLRASILDTPEDALHHHNLGLFFARHGYLDEALNKFDKTLALKPGDLDLHHRIGRALIEYKHPEAALKYYRAALAQDSTFFPALINAGILAGRMQRFAEALRYARRATTLKPRDSLAWYQLGLGLVSTGKREEAERALQRALELASPASEVKSKIRRLLETLDEQRGPG